MTTELRRKFNVQKQGGMIPTLFRGWKEWNEGDNLMAEFVQTKMGEYNGKPTPNHICKVLECNFTITTKDGEVDPTGKMLTLNSAGQLNKLLEGAEKGQVFTLTYDGKQKSTNPKDKQQYHTFSDLAIGTIDEGDESEGDYGL